MQPLSHSGIVCVTMISMEKAPVPSEPQEPTSEEQDQTKKGGGNFPRPRTSKGNVIGLAASVLAATSNQPAKAGMFDSFFKDAVRGVEEFHKNAGRQFDQHLKDFQRGFDKTGSGNSYSWEAEIPAASKSEPSESPVPYELLAERASVWAPRMVEIGQKILMPMIMNLDTLQGVEKLRMEEVVRGHAKAVINSFAAYIQEGVEPGSPGELTTSPSKDAWRAAVGGLQETLKNFKLPLTDLLKEVVNNEAWRISDEADVLRNSLNNYQKDK